MHIQWDQVLIRCHPLNPHHILLSLHWNDPLDLFNGIYYKLSTQKRGEDSLRKLVRIWNNDPALKAMGIMEEDTILNTHRSPFCPRSKKKVSTAVDRILSDPKCIIDLEYASDGDEDEFDSDDAVWIGGMNE